MRFKKARAALAAALVAGACVMGVGCQRNDTYDYKTITVYDALDENKSYKFTYREYNYVIQRIGENEDDQQMICHRIKSWGVSPDLACVNVETECGRNFKIALRKVADADAKMGARSYIEMEPDLVTLICIEEKGFQYKGLLSSKCADEQWEQEK